MKRSLALVPIALALTALAPRTPTAETEGISVDAPSAYSVGFRDARNGINVVELVRLPETVDHWTELVTVLTMMDMAKLTPLSQFYPLWRDQYREACPGPPETLLKGTVDAKPALKATFTCPRDPKTGKPEHLVAFFIQGDVNILGVHAAFRRPMTATDRAVVQQLEKTLKICDARDDACFKRRASGFLPKG